MSTSLWIWALEAKDLTVVLHEMAVPFELPYAKRKRTAEFDLGPSHEIVGSGCKNKPQQSKPLRFETGSHVA